MDDLFVVFLVLVSSAAAVTFGAKRLAMPVPVLRVATVRMFEAVGLAVGFFALNVALGVTLVLIGRVITRDFVSLYAVTEETLFVLSLLQGLTFLFWRNAQPK